MTTLWDIPTFGGSTFEPAKDAARLGKQLAAVRELMSDGIWRTLGEIEAATGYPQASISARLRDLRKQQFGAWTVQRRRRGIETDGHFEYRATK